MFRIMLVGIELIQKSYVSVGFKVYTSLVKGSSVYTQVGFSKVAYAFWCMIFEVAVGSEWWCRFLVSAQCFGDKWLEYSD